MVYRIWLPLLVAAWLFFLPPYIAYIGAATPNAEDVLQKVAQSSQTVNFVGKRIFMFYAPEGALAREELVTQMAPGKKRIEVISPPEMKGAVGVIDEKGGVEHFTISKKEGEFTGHRERPAPGRRPGPPFPFEEMDGFPLKNIRLLLRNYHVIVLDGGRIAQRNTYLLEAESKESGKPSRKAWVDSQTGVILKMEHYDPKKRLVWLFAYNEINFNPNIDGTIFQQQAETKTREGPRVRWKREELWNYNQEKLDPNTIRKAAQLNVLLPDQIPAGFTLQSINVLKFENRKSVHLRYTDGMIILSVFQSSSERKEDEHKPQLEQGSIQKVDINGIECEVISGGPMPIYRWSYGGVYLTLIGEMSQSEMVKIAGSFIREGGQK